MDAIKKLKFNNKEFNYYQQTIKTTLWHNELWLSSKLKELKQKYLILDNVITDKDINSVATLRNSITHNKSNTVNIQELFDLSQKMYYFSRECILYLISN
jgi:hypothetical protein